MSVVKQIMVNILISSIFVALLLTNSPCMIAHAAPQAAGAAAASGAGGAASGGASTTSTTTTSTSSSAAGSSAAGAAGAGVAVGQIAPLAGVQGLVGGALNIATLPLNTITASLNQLGLPTIATAPLSAVSSLFQQAGTVYGR